MNTTTNPLDRLEGLKVLIAGRLEPDQLRAMEAIVAELRESAATYGFVNSGAAEVVAVADEAVRTEHDGLIDRLNADDPDAYTTATDLLDRHEAALQRVLDDLLDSLQVPAERADRCRDEVACALGDHGVSLDALNEAWEQYRSRAEDRAVDSLIDTFEQMLEQSGVVRRPARDWLVSSMRAAAELGRQMPGLEPINGVEVMDGATMAAITSSLGDRVPS